MKVAVIYWTNTGNTEQMAEEIALGARDAGADITLTTYADTTPEEALQADRLILGCPAMGIEELEDGEVVPFMQELYPKLAGKHVAVFGPCGWSHGEWLTKWVQELSDAGAELVAPPLHCQGTPDDEGLASCRKLGQDIAQK